MRMATLHLFEDRDHAKLRRGFQQQNHLGVEEIRKRVRLAAGSHLLDGPWQRIVQFEAIGGRRADRRFGGRDCWIVCLSERHVAVEAMKVVHPGQRGEIVVARPINRTSEEPRMNLHKNARLTPQGRALLVQ
jgi:hypothetical protein